MNKNSKLLSLTVAILFVIGISCEYSAEETQKDLIQKTTNSNELIGTSDYDDAVGGNRTSTSEVKPVFNFAIKEVTIASGSSSTYTQAVTETGKLKGDDRSIIYSTDAPSIATVTSAGVVTLKTKGTVTITAMKIASAGYEQKTASYVIYHEIKPVNKFELKQEIDRAISAHGSTVDLNYIDTSLVQDMNLLFYNMRAFNGKIDKWNTSAVTDMSNMFNEAKAFNQYIGNWDVRAVENMAHMFNGAKAFNQDIGGWNVGAVTNMSSMFNKAEAFNQDIGGWNVGTVTNMSYMFKEAKIFNQDIGRWNVGAVTNMSSMFNKAGAFNQDIGRWNVGAVADMIFMFMYATKFDQNLSAWGKYVNGRTVNMSFMFLYSGVTTPPVWANGR